VNILSYVWDDKYLAFKFIAYEMWTIIIVIIIISIIIPDAVIDSDCEVISMCRTVCSLA